MQAKARMVQLNRGRIGAKRAQRIRTIEAPGVLTASGFRALDAEKMLSGTPVCNNAEELPPMKRELLAQSGRAARVAASTRNVKWGDSHHTQAGRPASSPLTSTTTAKQ